MTANPETYSFLGRVFTLVGDRYQCDRCRRTFGTIIQAAECDGPNHSQIRGGVSRRCTPIVIPPEEEQPRKRLGPAPKYATEQERRVAKARRQAEYWLRKRSAMTEDELEHARAERRRKDAERAAEYRRLNADMVRARERERSARRRAEDPERYREAVRQSREKWRAATGTTGRKRGRPRKDANRPQDESRGF